MKVAIIGSAHPLRGGLAAYNERLANAYIENGDDVTIYSFSLQYPALLFPGKSQFTSEPAPPKLKIVTCINSINPLNWIKTGKKIGKEKYDLIIVKYWLPFMGPCFGTILKYAKKNNSTKVISIVDNMIPHEKRPGDTAFTKYFAKQVDGFIAMSHSVLNDISLFDSAKPRQMVPHPLYDHFGNIISKADAKKKLNLSTAHNYLLFFGFIRDYKGLDWLIEAFSDQRLRNKNLKLLVAGEYYTAADPYLELIKKHRLENEIILHTDFIPDSKVGDYFNACDIVVQPYKDATQSGVTQIAYHFNKPMIVTNVGGLSEIVKNEKAGLVISPNPASIAEAILKFYTDNMEEKLIAGVMEEKKQYTWERMITAINNLL